MEPVLRADSVRKRYGENVALDGVSLTVGRGEVFALIGPNGAGKTTLVGALTGTKTPNDGRVAAFGDPVADLDRARVGVLPQDFTPPERLSAGELLDYYRGLYDDPRPVDDVLAEVGLVDAADARYGNLSGGQQRRACVGATLINDPDLLFLDEPTTGIDPAGRQSLWGLIEALAAGGTSVFLTTHYMDEAERLADRVGLLADGRLVATGTPASLVDAYGGTSKLVVETTDAPPTDVDDAAVRGPELVFEDVGPADIGDVVERLDDRSVTYDSLAWQQPTLEDVFLRLAEDGAGDAGDGDGGDASDGNAGGDTANEGNWGGDACQRAAAAPGGDE